ncbi:MAG: HAD-IC family P-type ATPase [Patescibacteria group bacterium]|jgi:Ca2+-transporting ATPase
MHTHLWHTFSIEKTLSRLHARREGLNHEQVERRRRRYGFNELPHIRRISYLVVFANQFRSMLIGILMVAAVVSFMLGETVDAYVIAAAILFNVCIGFIQEFRAERALEKLQRIVTFTTVVRREEKELEVPVTELVPGDIVFLRAGNRVPADVRLLCVTQLEVEEASLTGESVPVKKTHEMVPNAVVLPERINCAFFGTTVVRGSGEGVVIETGARTEIGKIAEMIAQTPDEATPLQKRLSAFGRTMGFIVLGISFLLFLAGIIFDYPARQMFTTAVAVAVAAIPEGLAVVVTVILAIGMQRILRKGSIVRKLAAAETLGSTTVICTDKTGTLTEGEMKVTRVVTYEQTHESHGASRIEHSIGAASPDYVFAMSIGVIASDAVIQNPDEALDHWIIHGTPTEKAIIHAATQAGIRQRALINENKRIDYIPFDSEWKFMATLNESSAHKKVFIKGAPEILLHASAFLEHKGTQSPMTPQLREMVREEFKRFSQEGLRMIAVGYRDVAPETPVIGERHKAVEGMTFVGLIGLKDPLRSDARATLDECRSAGIRPIMITGDHRYTAAAIAKELGMPHSEKHVIDGSEFEKMDQQAMHAAIQSASVFARITPRDKLRIVDALQERGEVVAMTGDGVNDAPALKSADIGIALGSGTDVAKETSDIVLLDNNVSTIVRAVREGRIIYQNIQRVILFLLSNSFSEILMIAVTLLIGGITGNPFPLPLLATQILWLNLLTEGVPTLALTLEKEEGDVMHMKPILRSASIMTKDIWILIIVVSIITGVIGLLLFMYLYTETGDALHARTVSFTALAVSSLMYVFSIRSLRLPLTRIPLFSNPLLLVSIIIGLGLHALAVYLPLFQRVFHTTALSFMDWILAFSVAAFIIVTLEITKAFLRSKRFFSASAR